MLSVPAMQNSHGSLEPLLRLDRAAHPLPDRLHKSRANLAGMTKLAFPDCRKRPAKGVQGALALTVAHHVPFKFLLPEPRVGLRSSLSVHTGMTVPKATVNKDHSPTPSEHDIGTARQICQVQAIPGATQLSQQLSYRQFGRRVAAAVATHVQPPLFGSQDVNHVPSSLTARVGGLDSGSYFVHSQCR